MLYLNVIGGLLFYIIRNLSVKTICDAREFSILISVEIIRTTSYFFLISCWVRYERVSVMIRELLNFLNAVKRIFDSNYYFPREKSIR